MDVFTKKVRPSKLCLKYLIVAYTAESSLSNALKRVSAGVSFLLKNESGCQTLLMYCCKTPLTAKSLAWHVIFNGAVWFGCTKRVALASICLDSINAKFALSSHFKSKFDLGDQSCMTFIGGREQLI